MEDLAVDCSNYTGALRAPDLHCWMSNGVKRVIVQAVNPPAGYPPTQTVQQLQACSEAGMAYDAYVYLWWSLPVSDIVGKLGLLRGYTPGQIWLDVEDNPGNLSTAVMVNKIQQALDLIDGNSATDLPAGIYTGGWWWRQFLPTVHAFADCDLWAAEYDGIPDSTVFTPFGGWTKAALKQYVGSTQLCGVSGIDMSVIAPKEAQAPAMIHVGAGMKAMMDAAGDRPLFGHNYHDETDDEGQKFTVEVCYGTKGLYASSNVDGPDKWVNAGPI